MSTRRFDWGLFCMLAAFVLFIAALGALLYFSIDSERRECHNAGGHMVSVNTDSVCVDRDDRVIHL